MQLAYYKYDENWNAELDASFDSEQTLIILFGSAKIETIKKPLEELVGHFPKSIIMGASSAGEIVRDELLEDGMVVAILYFEHTPIRLISQVNAVPEDSYESGSSIARALLRDDLKGMFVLSDGLHVNGSQLTKGINAILPSNIPVTGGLAGDDDRFEKTWVLVDGRPVSNYIIAVGFYGKYIHMGYSSRGGWDRLGMERKVTCSENNILYELDGQPALDIYKRYLGDKADGLPASGLLFPLELKEGNDSDETKVRTILAVNEEDHSITFAGDIPEGSHATLMKANFDRLIDGAAQAAESISLDDYHDEPLLNIAISCVGRRLVLKQRTENELEATLESLPAKTQQIGFYSYGEISPLSSGSCDLHNQTMTLTLIWEQDAPPA